MVELFKNRTVAPDDEIGCYSESIARVFPERSSLSDWKNPRSKLHKGDLSCEFNWLQF